MHVRSHVIWRELIRVWKPLPNNHVLKILKAKRTITVSYREPDTERCANKNVGGVDCEIPHWWETVGGEWIVRFHISGRRGMKHFRI